MTVNKTWIYRIVPFLELLDKNKILEEKYDLLFDKEYDVDLTHVDKISFLEELYKYQKEEDIRRTSIEGKGKSMLFVITLAITFLLGSINFIYQFQCKFNHILIIFLICGIIYLILSIISVIGVVETRPYSDLYLFKKFSMEPNSLKSLRKDSIIKKVPNEISDEDKIIFLIQSIELNECIISQKSNSLDCTFALIERSIILIAIFSILLLLNMDFKYYVDFFNCMRAMLMNWIF